MWILTILFCLIAIVGFALRKQKTEIAECEQAIVELRREWENIFQAIGNPTVILDLKHNIISANRAVVIASGMSEHELIGRKCYEIFHSKDTGAPPDGCPMERMLVSDHIVTVDMEMEAFGGFFLVSCTPVLENGHLKKSSTWQPTLPSERKKKQSYAKAKSVIVLLRRISLRWSIACFLRKMAE